MKHAHTGQLRAFFDDALSPNERETLQTHLKQCARCSQKADAIEKSAASVTHLMSSLSPHSDRAPVSPQVARQHFDVYVKQKTEGKMLHKLFSQRTRPVWAAVTLVLLLAFSLMFQPVRTLASNFLALFRVQEIKFIEFNPLNLPDQQTLENVAFKMEDFMMEEVVIEKQGKAQIVDAATAKTLVGFPVRFPAGMEPVHQIDVQPSIHVAMQVDLALVQALLGELGYANIDLPESLDGAAVSVDIAPSVTASYGECVSMDKNDCTLFIQMPSPDVNAPPELDLDQLGLLYLQMLGMSEREATRFSQNVDWTTTLVVPIPTTAAKYQDVVIDGVSGTFVQAKNTQSNSEYVLMWVKNDIVYGLAGSGDKASALAIAASLE